MIVKTCRLDRPPDCRISARHTHTHTHTHKHTHTHTQRERERERERFRLLKNLNQDRNEFHNHSTLQPASDYELFLLPLLPPSIPISNSFFLFTRKIQRRKPRFIQVIAKAQTNRVHCEHTEARARAREVICVVADGCLEESKERSRRLFLSSTLLSRCDPKKVSANSGCDLRSYATVGVLGFGNLAGCCCFATVG